MEILHPQPLISSWVSGAAVLARNPKLPCPVASSHLDGPGTTLRRCSDHVLHHGAAVLLWVSHRRVTCHPLSKRGATHLSEKTHFGPLYLQPCPIGQGPALKARGGGRNQAWPVEIVQLLFRHNSVEQGLKYHPCCRFQANLTPKVPDSGPSLTALSCKLKYSFYSFVHNYTNLFLPASMIWKLIYF